MDGQKPKRKIYMDREMDKKTGERAIIDAKVSNTYIVYEKDGVLVKHYPSGEIVPL